MTQVLRKKIDHAHTIGVCGIAQPLYQGRGPRSRAKYQPRDKVSQNIRAVWEPETRNQWVWAVPVRAVLTCLHLLVYLR
jgi:hypothetical protein